MPDSFGKPSILFRDQLGQLPLHLLAQAQIPRRLDALAADGDLVGEGVGWEVGKYVLRNEPSGMFYTFIGAAPHVERNKAHLFDSEQAAINAAAILNGAGRGNYIPERAQ